MKKMVTKIIGGGEEYVTRQAHGTGLLEIFPINTYPAFQDSSYLDVIDVLTVNALSPLVQTPDTVKELYRAIGTVPVVILVRGRDSMTAPRWIAIVPASGDLDDHHPLPRSISYSMVGMCDFVCTVPPDTNPLIIPINVVKNRHHSMEKMKTVADVIQYFKVFSV